MHPMSESPSAERHKKLLKKYVIPNMGDYTAVGGVLSSILDRLDRHKALSAEDKAFMRNKGLFDLCEFVKRLEETKRQDFHYLRAMPARSPRRRNMLWAKYGISSLRALMRLTKDGDPEPLVDRVAYALLDFARI